MKYPSLFCTYTLAASAHAAPRRSSAPSVVRPQPPRARCELTSTVITTLVLFCLASICVRWGLHMRSAGKKSMGKVACENVVFVSLWCGSDGCRVCGLKSCIFEMFGYCSSTKSLQILVTGEKYKHILIDL